MQCTACNVYYAVCSVQYSLCSVQSVLINIQVTAVTSSVEPGSMQSPLVTMRTLATANRLNSNVHAQERYRYVYQWYVISFCIGLLLADLRAWTMRRPKGSQCGSQSSQTGRLNLLGDKMSKREKGHSGQCTSILWYKWPWLWWWLWWWFWW